MQRSKKLSDLAASSAIRGSMAAAAVAASDAMNELLQRSTELLQGKTDEALPSLRRFVELVSECV